MSRSTAMRRSSGSASRSTGAGCRGRPTARTSMDVFDLRNRLVADYQSYTRSFIKIRDARVAEHVDRALGAGAFWPEPLLQLNPTFLPGGTIDDLVEQGILHRECARIFRI